jgi:hypothetical protein
VDKLSLMLLMAPSATGTADWSSSIALQQSGENNVTDTVNIINKLQRWANRNNHYQIARH